MKAGMSVESRPSAGDRLVVEAEEQDACGARFVGILDLVDERAVNRLSSRTILPR